MQCHQYFLLHCSPERQLQRASTALIHAGYEERDGLFFFLFQNKDTWHAIFYLMGLGKVNQWTAVTVRNENLLEIILLVYS